MNMQTRLVRSAGVAIALVALVAAVGSDAATDRYKFVGRGVVTAVNGEQKTVTVSFSHITGKGESDLKGKTQLLKASVAKIYKNNAANKEVRIKLTNLVVGDEIQIKGVAKSDGTYYLLWAKVNERKFEVVGTLKDHDVSNTKVTIAAKTSSYKPTVYKNKDIVMKYSGKTKFKSSGKEINADEVVKGDHKVKVSGKIVGGTWEIDTFIDNFIEKK